jgi:hypothetical protein
MVAKCTFVYPKMDSVAAEICNGITSRLLMKMPKSWSERVSGSRAVAAG